MWRGSGGIQTGSRCPVRGPPLPRPADPLQPCHPSCPELTAQPKLDHQTVWPRRVVPAVPILGSTKFRSDDVQRCVVASASSGRAGPRVRSHCRFRNRGTDYLGESGMKWMSGCTKRQCDRALARTPAAADRGGPGQTLRTTRSGAARSRRSCGFRAVQCSLEQFSTAEPMV
jgi:hypothetical protein